MDTKKAVKILKIHNETIGHTISNKLMQEIIESLEKSEKFEQIVDYLEKYCGYYYYGSSDNLSYLIPRLKQKYFPKPAKKITKIDLDKLHKELTNFHEELIKKYFPINDNKTHKFYKMEESNEIKMG